MSRTRSCTSKQPGPQLGVRAGVEAPLLTRPADGGGHAERRRRWPRPGTPTRRCPASLRTTFGTWSSHFAGTWFSYMSGGSIMWSSMLTRIMSSICMGVFLSGGGPELEGQAGERPDRGVEDRLEAGRQPVVGDARADRGARCAARSRARCDPRQRWIPLPNAMWRLTSRSKRTTSASSRLSGSAFAAPSITRTCWPLPTGHPPISVSSVVTRATVITGDSHRRSSSTAFGIRSGFSTSARRRSGCVARCSIRQSSDAETVSSPAARKRKQVSRTSSWVRRSPSTSNWRSFVRGRRPGRASVRRSPPRSTRRSRRRSVA